MLPKACPIRTAALFLSPKTVEHHLSSVYRKRGFRSRAELAGSFRTREDD
jgi:DNA-binding CsgD family transcriptional regulator